MCIYYTASMSTSMSRDVSMGGPNGHYAAHTSASVSRSAGPGYSKFGQLLD